MRFGSLKKKQTVPLTCCSEKSCFIYLFISVKPATSKSTDVSDGLFKPAKTLKQGSVLDLLKTPG